MYFIYLLHDLLSESTSEDDYGLKWNESGRYFCITNKERLADALPRLSQGTLDYTLFMRSMRMYFQEIDSGPCRGYYCNEHFIRSRPHLLNKVKPQPQNDGEPDLPYSVTPEYSQPINFRDPTNSLTLKSMLVDIMIPGNAAFLAAPDSSNTRWFPNHQDDHFRLRQSIEDILELVNGDDFS